MILAPHSNVAIICVCVCVVCVDMFFLFIFECFFRSRSLPESIQLNSPINDIIYCWCCFFFFAFFEFFFLWY